MDVEAVGLVGHLLPVGSDQLGADFGAEHHRAVVDDVVDREDVGARVQDDGQPSEWSAAEQLPRLARGEHRGRLARSSPAPHDRDRAGGTLQHGVADGVEHEVGDAAAATRPHHQQLGVLGALQQRRHR